MPRLTLLAALAAVGLILGYTGSDPQTTPVALAAENPAAEYAISGPYTHDNLSIFLLHGPDTLPRRNILTLDEALARGKAVVHETGTVNTLRVENLSDDSDLMMQNGDIVKGGKQDRVLRVAMILPPKSGPVAVESFCVEQGRWKNRGGEAVERFAANPGQISGRDLKMAVNFSGQQGEVWKNVALTQTALTASNGTSVTSNASPTSLQLATEDKTMQSKLAAYREPLGKILRGQHGVVGYAIAVNGKVTGAEVYGSSALMAKAWKKAVDSAALEAFAEKKPTEYAACNSENVRLFLADASGGKEEPTVGESARRLPNEVLGRTSAGLIINNSDTLILSGTNTYSGTINLTSGTLNVAPTNQLQTLNSARTLAFPQEISGGRASIGEAIPPQEAAQGRLNPLNFLSGLSAGGAAQPQPVSPAPAIQAPPVQVNRVTGTNGVLVESRDKANPGVIVHRTFIAK